jgi:hypothetical protein
MAKLTVAGRAFELAPFRLGSLRKAAAYLDRVNARMTEMAAADVDSLEAALESGRDMCEVLAIALTKLDPELDADWLEEQFGMDDMPALQSTFYDLLKESGLIKKGEAKGASEQAEAVAPSIEDSPISSAT